MKQKNDTILPGGFRLCRLTTADDAPLAALIRHSLRSHGLAIPGTAYFDETLDHLSEFYLAEPEQRAYFVLKNGETVCGGIGLAAFPAFPDCAELQKLYLSESVQGHGLGYVLIAQAEKAAKGLGYRQVYLETHTNLQAAIYIYEKTGYTEIERPESVVHSTMNRFYWKALGAGAKPSA